MYEERGIAMQRKKRGLLIGLCLVILTSISPSFPGTLTGKAAAELPPIATPQVLELVELGYSAADAFTAVDLEQKSGVSANVWLEKHANGASWTKIVQEMGVRLSAPFVSWSGDLPLVDGPTAKRFQDQGYTIQDVFGAYHLAHEFNTTMEKVFDLHAELADWALVWRNLKKPGEKLDRCVFDGFGKESSLTTETGMTRDVFCDWIQKGFTFHDVQMADLMTLDWEVTVDRALSLRKQGKDWPEIEKAFPRKTRLWLREHDVILNTGLRVEEIRAFVQLGYNHHDLIMANGFAKKQGTKIEAVLKEFDSFGRSWEAYQRSLGPSADDIARTLGWPIKTVEALVKKGAKPLWILQADYYAKREGLPFAQVLDEYIKSNGRRVPSQLDGLYQVGSDGKPQSIERTSSGLTLNQVNQLLKEFTWEEINLADQWAVRIGGTANAIWLLQEKKKDNLTWDQVVQRFYDQEYGTPISVLAKALGVSPAMADTVVLTRAEHNLLLSLGMDADGELRAGLIAKALTRPVVQVAKLKTPNNTWLDVVQLVKSGKK